MKKATTERLLLTVLIAMVMGMFAFHFYSRHNLLQMGYWLVMIIPMAMMLRIIYQRYPGNTLYILGSILVFITAASGISLVLDQLPL